MRSCKIQFLVMLCGDPGYRKYACAFHPAGLRPPPKVLALQLLGEPLGEALSVKPGMRAVGGMLVVCEEKTAEARERTEDERAETTIIPEAIGWTFLGWMECR